MNTSHELDRIVGGWLEARTVDPPHGSLASSLARVEQVPQQHHRWLPAWFRRGQDATEGALVHGPGDPSRERKDRRLLGAAIVGTSTAAIALAAAFGLWLGQDEPFVPAPGGAVHYVAEDGDFRTIGEAVRAAVDGDTVIVAPGTYAEALIIDKDITLVGEEAPGRATLLLVPKDAPDPLAPLAPIDPRADRFELPERVPVGVQIIDTDATLRNLRIIGEGEGIAMLVSGGAPTLEDLTIKHANAPLLETALAGALFIEDGSTASVRDSILWQRVRISGGSAPTISDSDLSGVALVVQAGSSPVFADNSLSGDCGCRDAIVVGGSTPTFKGNTFVFSGLDVVGLDGDGTAAHLERNRFSAHEADALSVSGGARVTIRGNRFYGNNQGVHVHDASAAVHDNEFVGNWNAVMLSATDATLADNTIRGGEIGISVGNGSTPSISGNLIENVGTRGIFVADGTSPTVEGNTICGSAENLVVGPAARPVLIANDICTDGDTAAG
jgi:parallel beta-helix repeat protein